MLIILAIKIGNIHLVKILMMLLILNLKMVLFIQAR